LRTEKSEMDVESLCSVSPCGQPGTVALEGPLENIAQGLRGGPAAVPDQVIRHQKNKLKKLSSQIFSVGRRKLL
jgi:hypothetical protein